MPRAWSPLPEAPTPPARSLWLAAARPLPAPRSLPLSAFHGEPARELDAAANQDPHSEPLPPLPGTELPL